MAFPNKREHSSKSSHLVVAKFGPEERAVQTSRRPSESGECAGVAVRGAAQLYVLGLRLRAACSQQEIGRGAGESREIFRLPVIPGRPSRFAIFLSHPPPFSGENLYIHCVLRLVARVANLRRLARSASPRRAARVPRGIAYAILPGDPGRDVLDASIQ